jgi:hypothetical protein
MNEKLAPVKEFVARNQIKILATVAVVSTTVAAYQQLGVKQHNDFLREKGLYEEFYQQED